MLNKHVIEKLSLYIDNLLTEDEVIKVEQHLDKCQDCKSQLKSLKQTKLALSKWQAPSPNPDFEQKVKSRIFNWEMEKETPKMRPKWKTIAVPATAIATILIVMLVGTQIYTKKSFHGNMVVEQRLASREKYAGEGWLGEDGSDKDRVDQPYFYDDEQTLERGFVKDDLNSAFKMGKVRSDGNAYDRIAKSAPAELKEEMVMNGTSPIIVVQPVLPAVGEGEKVIRTADVALEVRDGQDTYTKISQLCDELGGFLANSNFYKAKDGVQSGVITIRIPKDNFNVALERIRELGKVEHINTQSQDVSRQYADAESRLKTAMIVYDKMIKALEQRKITIPEAMRLESELTPITRRIETIKAEIERLNNLTSFTTLTVRFRESKISPTAIKESIKQAKENIVVYLLGALHFAVAAIPTLITIIVLVVLGLGVVLFIKRKINKYLNRKE